jgi:hypothetical protein
MFSLIKKQKKTLQIVIATLLVLILILPALTFATEPLKYQPLEGSAFDGFVPGPKVEKGDQLGLFLSQAFQFGLAIAAALAVIMIVWGGVEIMLSESVFSKDDGKKKIQDAIWGLILALVSWLILYTINPAILNFNL